ncbi:MAG: YraN family protein [Armatimonadota bacterium]|jgi:putative endonuclease
MRAVVDAIGRAIQALHEFFGAPPERYKEPNPLAWLGQKGKGHERHQAGWRAETYAAHRLVERGYYILGRNVYVGVGEIDIVAEHDRRLVFIEVRSRSLDTPVRPSSTVTLKKSRQVLRCARAYMRRHGLKAAQVNPRYDIAEIYLDENGQPCSFDLLEAAVTDNPRPRR